MKKIIIYDFDGTITPQPITNFKILEECGFIGGGNNKDLQNIVINKIKENNLTIYEAFHETILEIIESNGYPLKDEIISKGADKIDYNIGIISFFETLNKMNVDNYIVSSSMKPFLENTMISKYIKEIYATTFKYDKNNNIIGIDFLMSDEKKIDAIKNIVGNNDYRNVIYIGDGLTDLKAMKYIKDNGGISIFVSDEKPNIENEEDISFFFNRDYSKGSNLSNFILDFIK